MFSCSLPGGGGTWTEAVQHFPMCGQWQGSCKAALHFPRSLHGLPSVAQHTPTGASLQALLPDQWGWRGVDHGSLQSSSCLLPTSSPLSLPACWVLRVPGAALVVVRAQHQATQQRQQVLHPMESATPGPAQSRGPVTPTSRISGIQVGGYLPSLSPCHELRRCPKLGVGTRLSCVALGEGPQMHSGTWQNFLSRHPPTVTHVEQALLVSLQPDTAPQVTAQSCRPHGPSPTPSAAPAASGPCEDPPLTHHIKAASAVFSSWSPRTHCLSVHHLMSLRAGPRGGRVPLRQDPGSDNEHLWNYANALHEFSVECAHPLTRCVQAPVWGPAVYKPSVSRPPLGPGSP